MDLGNIIGLGSKHYTDKLRQAIDEAKYAHELWGPIVALGAQGDSRVTDPMFETALRMMAKANAGLGPGGKHLSEVQKFDAEQSRLASRQSAALDQFRAKPAPTGPEPPPPAAPEMFPGMMPSLAILGAEPRNFTPPGTYGPPPGADLSALAAPAALPGRSPVQLNGISLPPTGSLRANPADVTRAAAARESAIDTAKFSAQREAQLREAQELSKFKLGQVESLRGPGGQIELNPETLIKAGALGIALPMFSRGIVPQKIETDASQLSPEQVSAYQSLYGQPPQGKVTLLRNNITGETVGMFPGWAGTQTVTTPSGGVGNLNRGTGTVAPIAGAVPTNQATPHLVDVPGGRAFVRPLDTGAPAPIPGVFNPALAGTQTSTTPTIGGGTVTQRTRTPPAQGVAAGGPRTPSAPRGASVDRRVDSIVAELTRPNLSNAQQSELWKIRVGSDKALANAVRQRLDQDQSSTLSWDMATAERAQFSSQALSHIAKVDQMITNLDREGQLGPVMSRWNEFWTGKIGQDLTKNAEYVQLARNLSLLATALGRIHGGARGGGSIEMMRRMEQNLNVAKMDAATLRSALQTEKDWLSTYANPAGTTGTGGGRSKDPLGIR